MENKDKICANCGHTHMALVGDRGEYEDELVYERLMECSECGCEKFVQKKAQEELNKLKGVEDGA